jgi:hypothetical protein
MGLSVLFKKGFLTFEFVFHTNTHNSNANTTKRILNRAPGIDVMITIFSDFRRKKLAFFSNTNVTIKILHNLALSRVESAKFFTEFFGKNI